MRPLFNFSERGEVRELVSRVTEYRSVQGVVIDYDPLWMELWRLRCLIGDHLLERHIHRVFDWYRFGPSSVFPLGWISSFAGYTEDEPCEIEPPDPSWMPSVWFDLQAFSGRPNPSKEPFVVKICLLPWQPEEATLQLGEYPFSVIKERRAPAEFSMPMRQHRPVIGGVSIGLGARESGTLGGIVEDQNGTRWGMTCAHVVANAALAVDQPAQCDNSAATAVGSGRHLAVLKSSPASTPCNPYNSSTPLNSVDAALIEFSPGTMADLQVLNHGSLSAIMSKSTPSPGQLVEMAGKQSGSRVLEIGGLAITYRLRDSSGNFYCFNHLFELRWPRWWRVVGGRPIQRGDSGGWIISAQASGNEWVGMALAGDRLLGYAMFAENVADWAKTQHGLDIRVV